MRSIITGMDLATSSEDIQLQPSTRSFHCYRVSSLTETILDSTEISNLEDRYILGEQLGWGQFGVIRACSDKLTGEVLACKSIAKDRLVTLDDVRSVKNEIEIMSKLSGHPNVVNLEAVYEEDDHVHLLMELCAGGELFHWLEKYGKFSEYDARVIFRQLMQVVQYCHDNGTIHRDLKPENILLATKSSLSPIKLADFGLATYIKPGEALTFILVISCMISIPSHNLHGTVGSPFYIAPEVLAGGYNLAADVWSAGVILYILLSGMPPFWGKTKSRIFDAVRAAELQFPPDVWDRISRPAKELITGMLCVDPSKRLNAAQDCQLPGQESYKHDYLNRTQAGEDSFSTGIISRHQDFSFSYESPAISEKLDDTSHSESEGFTFNCVESGGAEFSSSFQSTFSFTFFNQSSAVQPFTFQATESNLDASPGESRLEKLFLPDTCAPVDYGVGEITPKIELRRQGINGSRVSSIPSRRNHTIGLGELDQLNIIVTESVIRWASCTHIPTTPSLRLSL
ncbi:hypothetical protein Tsubulata_031971, partial [Turnera subulata]